MDLRSAQRCDRQRRHAPALRISSSFFSRTLHHHPAHAERPEHDRTDAWWHIHKCLIENANGINAGLEIVDIGEQTE